MARHARIPRTPTEQFKRPTFVLDDETAAAIAAYHASLNASGMSGYPSDTMREIVQLGLDRIPEKATARRAYSETRHYVLTRTTAFLSELIREVEFAYETGARLIVPTKDDPNNTKG